MSVYIYDLDPPDRAYDPRRKWEELVAPHEARDWYPTNDTSENGDIVICHWKHTGDRVITAARAAAARGVAVVFISGGRLSGKVDRQPWGPYHRQAFVARPLDPAFTAAFQRFANYLKLNGRPRWDLIEPVAAPESLLAYYLCLLADAAEMGNRPVGGQTLLEAARSECDELLRALSDASLPPVGCELNRQNIQHILSVI